MIAVALREIRKWQRTGDLLIPKLPFSRLVREVTEEVRAGLRFQRQALLALQEMCEAFLVGHLEGIYHKFL